MEQISSIFSKIKKDHFFELLDLSFKGSNIDKEDFYNEYQTHLKNHLSKDPSSGAVKNLEQRWYKSLEKSPDYLVYNEPFYICDIWLCWTKYSRTGLLAIKSPKSLVTKSIVESLGNIEKVLDLGCGFGYTTAGLKELFPTAEVYGTNLKESYQYKIAESVGKKYGFKIKDNPEKVGHVDLIFASEYFEHIQNPIEHLNFVLRSNRPKYLLIANGFNGIAIGHFNTYYHLSKEYSAKEMNKKFNDTLSRLGYRKIKTKVWNNRPSLWIKT